MDNEDSDNRGTCEPRNIPGPLELDIYDFITYAGFNIITLKMSTPCPQSSMFYAA